MKLKRFLSTVLTLSVMAASISGCGNGGGGGTQTTETAADTPDSSAPAEGGEFNFAVEEDVLSLDPAYGYSLSTSPGIHLFQETMLEYDNTTGELKPNLADSWEMSEDGMVYTINLKEGIKFWDGNEMTADDAIFSIQHIMDPDVASYMAFCYEAVDTVEKIDDYSFKINLKYPDATFKYALCVDAGTVIEQKYYEEHSDNYGTPEGGVMGTGPYIYDNWIQGQQVTGVKNENYWDADNMPKFDKVNIMVLPDSTTRLNALGTGDLNCTFQVPTNQVDLVKSMPNVELKYNPAGATHAIHFNTQVAPFDDKNVRLAMQYAFDKDLYYNTYIKEAGLKGDLNYITPGLRTLNEEAWKDCEEYTAQYNYDMEKAKECLANSAYPDGFEAEFIVSNQDIEGKNALLQLQDAVKDMGITINIRTVTYGEIYEIGFSAQRDYQAFVLRWDCDYPDPATDLIPTLHSAACGEGGGNFCNYQNPEVDALLDEQSKLTDDAERGELIAQACKLIADDAPFICFAYPYRASVRTNDVGGYDEVSLIYWWSTFYKYMYFK